MVFRDQSAGSSPAGRPVRRIFAKDRRALAGLDRLILQYLMKAAMWDMIYPNKAALMRRAAAMLDHRRKTLRNWMKGY